MKRLLLRPGTILTCDHADRTIEDGGILIAGEMIDRVLTKEDLASGAIEADEIVDLRGLIALPGFVHTHVHLCQTLFRGLAEDVELLDWLRKYIFPLEAAHSPHSMYASAQIGLAELIRSGTTTIMDMGSVHYEDEIVRAVTESGIRAFLGKAMMDINDLYPGLREPTESALKTTLHQAEQWHGSSGGRVQYAVAPRYVLSCTDALLTEAYAMTRSFPGMLFHTHASENRSEMDAVRARCGMDNIEYFEYLGILHANTCLAHCIWLNDGEVRLMRERRAKVLHCPSSNLKLGSGIAPIPRYLSSGIGVSLGADGAPCNNSMNMFQEMRLAALIQKPLHGPTAMPALSVLRMATLAGAHALGLGEETGSIEPGKRADLQILDTSLLPAAPTGTGTAHPATTIVYYCGPENVVAVMANGAWLYREGRHTTIDVSRSIDDGRRELRSLLSRMPST